MCDSSSRPAAVSFAIYCCCHFLEVPHVVHRAGLVCQLWHKYTRSDALWEALWYRDTPPVVHAALEEVIANPLIDPVFAASAGVAAMLQQGAEDRWDAVKWPCSTRCATTASTPHWEPLHTSPTFSASWPLYKVPICL